MGINRSGLNQANDMQDQNLEEFIYRLSHDLSAPVRQVGALADLLENGDVEEEGVKHYLALISQQSKLAQEMLAALLDTSRITVNRARTRRLDLRFSMRQLEQDLPLLSVSVGVEGPCGLRFDPQMFAEMVEAIGKNVLEHSGTSELSVQVDKESHNLERVYFSDRGCGMTEEHWCRFQLPFQRAAGKPESGALGLGLYRARRLAEVNGYLLDRVPSDVGFVLSLVALRRA